MNKKYWHSQMSGSNSSILEGIKAYEWQKRVENSRKLVLVLQTKQHWIFNSQIVQTKGASDVRRRRVCVCEMGKSTKYREQCK